MNYRHAFHAGNFADVVKHAALLAVMEALQAKGPLTVIDTHGGAGDYDLAGGEAARTGEADGGVVRLLKAGRAPEAFGPYIAAIRAENPDGRIRRYPGSPLLIARRLGPGDSLIAVESQGETFGDLAAVLKPFAAARAVHGDGYRLALERLPARGETLVHIDPPYEGEADYDLAARTALDVARRCPGACVMIWTPLKDLETFDRLLRRLEAPGHPPVLIAETRLRPLSDPMKMNGCALVFVNPPAGVSTALEAICAFAAQTLGEVGAEGRVWRLS